MQKVNILFNIPVRQAWQQNVIDFKNLAVERGYERIKCEFKY